MKQFFTDYPFSITYQENIEIIPDSILCIPFVCSVLPIIWLTDSTLCVDEIDGDFYNCLSSLKNGYKQMFPESEFSGKLQYNKIINNISNGNEKAMFYSGGLDSINTLCRHYEENPDLLSIWGSDIDYENENGWSKVQKVLLETADRFKLKYVVIHSSFRKFDNEIELDKKFSKQLRDGWWHGVKHGIALLGNVAPYAYLHGINTMYIASSNCKEDKNVRCASNPLTDNCVRFCGCHVVHDGFEHNRQEKIHNIVNFKRIKQIKLPFHVCWESQSGNNCCHCEKCYRTMIGLVAENENPEEYGFLEYLKYIESFYSYMVENKHTNKAVLSRQWGYIQKALKHNEHILKKRRDWKYIKWLLKIDVNDLDTIKYSYCYRAKRKIKSIINIV